MPGRCRPRSSQARSRKSTQPRKVVRRRPFGLPNDGILSFRTVDQSHSLNSRAALSACSKFLSPLIPLAGGRLFCDWLFRMATSVPANGHNRQCIVQQDVTGDDTELVRALECPPSWTLLGEFRNRARCSCRNTVWGFRVLVLAPFGYFIAGDSRSEASSQ